MDYITVMPPRIGVLINDGEEAVKDHGLFLLPRQFRLQDSNLFL